MTREELWAEYVRQNPSFAGDKPVKITPASLRKLFDLTWDTSARREASFRERPVPPGWEDVFTRIFSDPHTDE